MNIADYNRQIQNVIDWNAVARNMTHTFDQSVINKQAEYVHEEIMETITAASTKNIKELFDGAGDIFVTLAYKYFLLRGEFNNDFVLDDIFEEEDFANDRKRQQALIFISTCISGYNLFGDTVTDLEQAMSALWTLMESIEKWYSVDMHAVVDEVMRSNWSKFPEFDEAVDYSAECRWIEEARGQTAVAFSVVEVNGVKRVSFRNQGGTGKIMKPACFFEPDVMSLLNAV